MTIAQSQRPEVLTPLRWTREEYYRLAELGFLSGQRVMLIDGDIITMPPQKNDHAWAITILAEKLRDGFGSDFTVREEKPLHVGDNSEPEPDIAVVEGSLASWRGKPHPHSAVLVVEVADSSVDFDLNEKASLYASAGVCDYWVLNLRTATLHVMRTPIEDSQARFGKRYDLSRILNSGEFVSPTARPGCQIHLSEILP